MKTVISEYCFCSLVIFRGISFILHSHNDVTLLTMHLYVNHVIYLGLYFYLCDSCFYSCKINFVYLF